MDNVIKDVARSVFRRCLPVLLALALTVAHGSADVRRPATGHSAVVASPVEQPQEIAADDDAATADAIIDREQVLTAQNTVSIGVSRAPPAAAV